MADNPTLTTKKKAKRRPAYKLVQRATNMSAAVSDAFSEIESLAEEMRETYDNMDGNGLGATEKCQAAGSAADALECATEVDVPECLVDVEVHYSESVNVRKNRGPSRAARLSNAVSVLEAAKAAAEEADLVEDAAAAERDDFVSELESAIGEVEGTEFPGMFG
ncbi:hypothetical protein D3C87_1299140 [compost metagenome]